MWYSHVEYHFSPARPRDMSSANQDRFRQTWKLQELSGKPAQAWLIIRRTVATLLAIGLIIFFGVWLFRLFWVPKAYLAYWSASTYQPLSAGPLKYACDDFAAVETLKDGFVTSKLVDPAEAKLTKELLVEKLRELSSLGMRSKDTCVMFLTAHGGAQKDGFLLCEPGDEDSQLPLADLFADLKDVTAGTKLLVLDTGRDELVPELGKASQNTFPALLAKAVKESADPSLWVMTANSSLERSHVSPELGRSVFGFVVTQGLRGAADLNHDGEVRLDELYNYVQTVVVARVKKATSAGESQTPQLFHYDPEMLTPDHLAAQRLVSVSKQPAEPEQPVKHVAEHEAAHGGERSGISQWFADRTTEVKDRLSPTGEVEIFKHMLGMHEGPEESDGETQEARASGAADEHLVKGQAEDKNAAPPEALSEAKIEPAEIAKKQIKDAWKEVARLEATANPFSSIVVAPPAWRELLGRLLWCDQVCASGVPPAAKASWKDIAKGLQDVRKSLKEFAAFRPPLGVNVPPGQPVSFALVELLAARDSKKAPAKPVAEFVAAYNNLLLPESSASFKDKLNKLLAEQKNDLGLTNYYEFQLLGLSKDPEIPSDILQLASRARRMGEAIATNPLCGAGWSRAAIEDADRMRSEGERQLLDRTSNDWDKLARDRLIAATTGYESAYRNLEFIRGTIQHRNDGLLRAPDLVRRAYLNGGDNTEIDAAKKVFSSLEALDKELASPDGGNIESLKRLREQLRDANAALDQKTAPADSAWRMANLLATTIPLPDVRAKLEDELAAAERKQMSSFKLPESKTEAVASSVPNDEQWKRAKDEFELQIALARLAGCDEKEALEPLRKSLDVAPAERIAKLSDVRNQLAELFEKLPASIASNVNVSGKDRPEKLAQLRSAMPKWLLLGPQSRDQLDAKNNLAAELDRADWYDLLVWNSERFHRAADDAPVAQVPFLRNACATFQALANADTDQPRVAPSDPPTLSIEAPDELSLLTAKEAPLTFKVKSTTSDKKPVWLLAQYNDKWLDVGPGVLSPKDLKTALEAPNLGEKASRYPLRPDALHFEASDQLSSGSPGVYTLNIKRQPNADAGGTAKLILKAVSGETFVRRELAVQLPSRGLLDVTVNAAPEFWDPATHVLNPLPNRVQNFTFDVVNGAKVAKDIVVSVWAPTTVPSYEKLAAIPFNAMSKESADQLLEPFSLRQLGPDFPINLPATDAPVRVKLSANDDAKVKPPANLLLKDKADPATFTGIQLESGLIFRLADKQSDQVTIRRIEITPQRPHGFLEAFAHYDRNKELFQINVKATKPAFVPPDGLKISARVSGVSEQGEKSLTDTLKGPSYEVSLHAELLRTGPPNVTAYVDVDDYPRAFVFKFARKEVRPDSEIPPETNVRDVRIVGPESGAAFRPIDGRTTLKVKAEVDAPRGAFGYADRTSRVELGIDQKQQRTLVEGDPVAVRQSDRQVTVTAKGLSPDGSLALDTRVGDFEIDLPTGLTNKKVNVIGRLVIGETSSWSDPNHPVEVILDGAPPVIHADFPLPPGAPAPKDQDLREIPTVEKGDELLVHVFMHDDDKTLELSGVQKVEAVFDSEATKDAKPATPEIGLSDGKGGWTAKLNTKDVGLGIQTVRIWATDKVGNDGKRTLTGAGQNSSEVVKSGSGGR